MSEMSVFTNILNSLTIDEKLWDTLYQSVCVWSRITMQT